MILPARLHRPLQMGRNGAVGSNHPQATLAGLDVLRAGGNAMDAAVAVSLVLGVCEPSSSGLGGDGFYHVHIAATGRAEVFNASGTAPLAATPDSYAGGIPTWGPRSVSVPGLLAGVAAMHAAHGSRPWAGLVAPAIALARDGFAATHTYCRGLAEHHERLEADSRSAACFLGKRLGDLVQQTDLARTLEEIAADGAETFYRGRLAERLVQAMQEQGVPDFDVASWYGVAAPASTPRPIIERLGREIVDALHDPAIIQKTRDFGAEPMPLLPRDYDAFMAAEVTKWAPVVAAAGATVD